MTQTTLSKPAGKAAASKKSAKPDSDDDDDDDDDMSDGGLDDDDDFDDASLSHTPPKKTKKAPAPKKSGSQPLADVENESIGNDGQKDSNVSEKYQKVSNAIQNSNFSSCNR